MPLLLAAQARTHPRHRMTVALTSFALALALGLSALALLIHPPAVQAQTPAGVGSGGAGKERRKKAAGQEDPQQQPRILGLLLFPGFETLDACGPLEFWGNLRGRVKVVTVAAKKGAVPSSQGPAMVAVHDFVNCPPLDLILVPGGFAAMDTARDPATLAWLKERAARAEITMSVCNGASILAAAGLLDGRPATTNKAFWKLSTSTGPQVRWQAKARWVDDGNIVTSSGVSAGMDMTLHVISRLYGPKAATKLAASAEYEWHQDPAWDPFATLHGLAPVGP